MFKAIKAPEHSDTLFFRNARSIIRHFGSEFTVIVAETHGGDPCSARRVPQRVLDQIGKELNQEFPVSSSCESLGNICLFAAAVFHCRTVGVSNGPHHV